VTNWYWKLAEMLSTVTEPGESSSRVARSPAPQGSAPQTGGWLRSGG
jgi:hypothetical protein